MVPYMAGNRTPCLLPRHNFSSLGLDLTFFSHLLLSQSRAHPFNTCLPTPTAHTHPIRAASYPVSNSCLLQLHTILGCSPLSHKRHVGVDHPHGFVESCSSGWVILNWATHSAYFSVCSNTPSLMLKSFPIMSANRPCCQPAGLSNRSSEYSLKEPLYHLQSDHLCLSCRILFSGTIGKNWKRVGKGSSGSFSMASWTEKQLRKGSSWWQQELEPKPVYCALI